MTIIAPTPITALPTVPSLSDVSTFSARTDAFINALPEFRTDTNDIATNVYNNATEVATLAGTATTEAGTATTQAGIATTQAGIATAQAGIATTQAGNAAASYTSFDTRYLGPKASNPALDNQGGALVVGALYFSTTLNNMRIYDGANWILAAGQITGTFAVLRESHTATAAQTVFSLTNTYITGTNTIMVYKNGVRLLAADYTETSTTSITMTSAAAAGDEYFFEIGVVATGTSTNAGNITFNPAGSLSSTNVQAAITELDTEKQVALISGSNIRTVNGSSILGSGDLTITTPGSGGTTSTASINLTASSPAAMTVTPANPGLYVTLPDATTCTKADNLYSVYNAGDYDYGVKDSAGTQLGWIRARTGAMIGLADNATAAGVWSYYGLEKLGITAMYGNATLTGTGTTTRRIALDANRTCFVFGGAGCYAIVYDASTLTWGSATLVRSGIGGAKFLAVLAATDKVLVCSCDTGVSGQFVTLSISGTTVTVNTPVSKTFTGTAISSFGQFVAVGAAFVASFGYDASTSSLIAVTVSGTVPTVGTQFDHSPGVGTSTPAVLIVSGSVLRCVLANTNTLRCVPVTISGTTITQGTATSATTTASEFRAFLNGNGNIVCHYVNSTHYATIFKLTGTTEAASSVSLGGTAPATLNAANTDYVSISASKTALGWINNGGNTYSIQLITDTAGTISAGTRLDVIMDNTVTTTCAAPLDGSIARFLIQGTNGNSVISATCSTASPVIYSVARTNNAAGMTYPTAGSDKYGVIGATTLSAGVNSYSISGFAYSFDLHFGAVGLARRVTIPISNYATNGGLQGATPSDKYIAYPYANSSTGFVITRVEAAA